MPELKEITTNASLFGVYVLCAVVAVRTIPLWLNYRKEVRLAEIAARKEQAEAEINVRKEEVSVRMVEAESIGKLSETLKLANEVSEELKIFLRSMMREHEIVRQTQMQMLTRIDRIEHAVGSGAVAQ